MFHLPNSSLVIKMQNAWRGFQGGEICIVRNACASTLACDLSALSTRNLAFFSTSLSALLLTLIFPVKFKLLEDKNVFHVLCAPSVPGPKYCKNYKVFSHLSTEFDFGVRSMTRSDLKFSSRIILGERLRAKKPWCESWLQHL